MDVSPATSTAHRYTVCLLRYTKCRA